MEQLKRFQGDLKSPDKLAGIATVIVNSLGKNSDSTGIDKSK